MGANENRFRPCIDAAPVLLWAAGPDGRCFFFNKRWLDFAGRSLNEQLACDWMEDIHAEDRARCKSIYSTSFSRHEEFQIECRLRRKDGEYRWTIANGAPHFSPSGAFAGFVGSFLDVHELGFSTNAGEAGARRLVTLGKLAAGIAHDFNNLLANILANAELALTAAAPGAPAAQELERIRTVALQGSEIVRELMVYASQDQPHAEAVDLSRLVSEMVEILRISVTKGARIATELANDLPPIVAEPAEIRELLMNLILNASDALGEKEGEIRISTSRMKDGRGPGGNGTPNPGGDWLQLVVADSGLGIAQSVQSRIFDAFASTKQPGRGVGLAIVRTIARKYGGTVRFTTVPGRGTRFTVLLPSSAGQIRREEPAQPLSAQPAGAGRMVLMVDDEDGLRLAVSQLLRRDGFRVIEAPDGSAAVELLRTYGRSIDLILLDLTLPGLTSEAVIDAAARIHPEVRIVLTSAYSRGNAAAAFRAPQVKGFIRKPYRIRELVHVLADEEYVNTTSGSGHSD